VKVSKSTKVILFILTLFVTAMFLLPIIWMLSSSLKDNNSIFKVPPDLIPKPALWKNYLEAVLYIPFFKYLKNTAVISLLSTLGMVISTPSVAYAFAKMKWPGRSIAFVIVLSTMMLPFQVQIIPLYVIFKKIGWIGTILPLVVPNFFSNALYIFLIRQFMVGIPDAVCESAFIDGAGHFTILTRIVVPFCLPAIFAVGLFTFMGCWTDFFGPLIFLSNENTYTLSLGLQQFSSVHHTQWNYLMAACVMFTVPVLTLFFFTQRFFLQGITFSGVKG
jgi:multiple sugar transport system permease protein